MSIYSLDIDEYVIPPRPGLTIVDALVEARDATNRAMFCAGKLNFVSTPHTLEPVHLLTIEACVLEILVTFDELGLAFMHNTYIDIRFAMRARIG